MLALLLVASAFARSDIAVLVSDSLSAYEAPVARFRETVGRPVTVFQIEGERARADSILKQLAADPPPLVFAVGAKAAYAAVNGLQGVPIVYAMVFDPRRYGISGTQVTGVSMDVPAEATLSQFQLFAPDVKRLGVLLSANNTSPQVQESLAAAKRLGFTVEVQRVTNARDVRAAWQRTAGDVDALWLLQDPVVMSPDSFRWLRADTLRRRLPVLAATENLVRAGALLCVAPDREMAGQQAGELATRILDGGELPGMIQPVLPGAMRVVLNRDTLDTIGVEVDELMLDFADEVVRENEGR
jgi:putative ABC transport system substrate-binding protein